MHLFHKDVSEQLNCKQTGETVECSLEKQWGCQLEIYETMKVTDARRE